MARVLTEWLTGLGFNVTVVVTMAEALRFLAENPTLEVITLDLNLPDSRAPQTVPRIPDIRNINPEALLLIVSGVVTEEDKKLASSLGADVVFEKLEVPTERTFLQKFGDAIMGLIKTPAGYTHDLALLQAVSSKIAQRCNEMGIGLGAGVMVVPASAIPSASGMDTPPPPM